SAVLPQRVDSALTADAEQRGSLPTPRSLTVSARPIRRPVDLIGREVHLSGDRAYVEQLIELEDQAEGTIYVVEVDTTMEALIREVARGDIDYTVASENVAELEQSYYTNLSITPALGPTHPVTWAVRGNSPLLLRSFNEWIGQNREGERFQSLYQKYYVDRRAYRERVESRYLTTETGTLSDYDGVLRAAAATIGWDWRLLASQAYQESRFDPRAESWAGAMGLLQLMPATAAEIGVTDPWDPRDNAMGAARYLAWLDEHFWSEAIPDEHERLKFILASYNAGAGHVMDAQRLATAAGDDPLVWEDVAYWLLEKSKPEVYERPEVRHGFCRGLEPVQYVARILDRYDHYRQFVREGAPLGPGARPL
ncbi:MAG TPA: transglycosylase SLT domain-containing protein, partial [Rhodothermales bacterium]|nr:transglycosylase SLT domain-containing protein [Rhodothermales bacterium]